MKKMFFGTFTTRKRKQLSLIHSILRVFLTFFFNNQNGLGLKREGKKRLENVQKGPFV